MPDATDGQRGRILRLAVTLGQSVIGDRVKYFIDADFDHLSSAIHPHGVIATDFRDLENYANNQVCLDNVCLNHLNMTEGERDRLVRTITNVGVPFGVIRYVSHIDGLNIPFCHILIRDAGKRFTVRKDGQERVADMARYLTSIGQEMKLDSEAREALSSSYTTALTELSGNDRNLLVHGKDLIAIFSWIFTVSLTVAEALLWGAIHSAKEQLRTHPNLGLAEQWVRS